MSEQTEQTTKTRKAPSDKTPIYRMTIPEVDVELAECERVINTHSSAVKAKLAGNRSIPSDVLRELSRANLQKGKLVMRRISILLELGEPAAVELIDKLLKVQPATN